jgi:uncharacterized protein with PIN domain
MIDGCGLCGRGVFRPSNEETTDWAKYDRYGREGITGESVEFNRLPEKVQLWLKQKKASIKEDALICPECYSRTLDDIWVAERAVCKTCNTTLEDIGWSLEQPQGHSIMSTRLMGCPECRIVYFIPSRPITQ